MYFLNAESIKLKTENQCRGPILISKQTKWEDVCIKDFPTGSEGELCRQLGCVGGNSSQRYRTNKVLQSEVSGAEHRKIPGQTVGSLDQTTNDNQFFFLQMKILTYYACVHRLSVSNANDAYHHGVCSIGLC